MGSIPVHDQGRTNPCPIALQRAQQLRPGRIRSGKRYSVEMFERLLSGVRSLNSAYCKTFRSHRNMPNKRDSQGPSLVCDCKVSLAREMFMDLDEINSLAG